MNNSRRVDEFNISRLNISRREGQSWEQAFREDIAFWRLPKAKRSKLLAWAKKEDDRSAQQLLAARSTPETKTPPPESDFFIPDGMTPEQATREKIKRDAEMHPIEKIPNLKDMPVHELAKLKDWTVPPSRRQELREYRDSLRRKAIADRDAKAAAVRTSRPGERWPDPREYWPKNELGAPHPKDQKPTQAPMIDAAKNDNPAPISGICEEQTSESLAPQERQFLGGHQSIHLQPAPAIYENGLLDLGCTGAITTDSPNCAKKINNVRLMSSCVLEELLLSPEFHNLPSNVKEAIVDRFLELEEEATWQRLEEESP